MTLSGSTWRTSIEGGEFVGRSGEHTTQTRNKHACWEKKRDCEVLASNKNDATEEKELDGISCPRRKIGRKEKE